MPKEYSHWHLAHRIVDRLAPGPLADAAVAYDEFVLAGAVVHDSGYYSRNSQGKAVADRLHGTAGCDSFEPFRRLAAHRDEVGAPGFAFGLGALTHLAADATFHPLAYSWTGDPEAPDPQARRGAVYRHLACEAALDMHFEALWGPPPTRTFDTLAHKGKVGRTETLALDLAAAWQKVWASGDEPYAGQVGPCLDTGIPANEPQAKRHFSLSASTVWWGSGSAAVSS